MWTAFRAGSVIRTVPTAFLLTVYVALDWSSSRSATSSCSSASFSVDDPGSKMEIRKSNSRIITHKTHGAMYLAPRAPFQVLVPGFGCKAAVPSVRDRIKRPCLWDCRSLDPAKKPHLDPDGPARRD